MIDFDDEDIDAFTHDRLLQMRAWHRKHLLVALVERNWRGVKYRRFLLRTIRNLDRLQRQRGVV